MVHFDCHSRLKKTLIGKSNIKTNQTSSLGRYALRTCLCQCWSTAKNALICSGTAAAAALESAENSICCVVENIAVSCHVGSQKCSQRQSSQTRQEGEGGRGREEMRWELRARSETRFSLFFSTLPSFICLRWRGLFFFFRDQWVMTSDKRIWNCNLESVLQHPATSFAFTFSPHKIKILIPLSLSNLFLCFKNLMTGLPQVQWPKRCEPLGIVLLSYENAVNIWEWLWSVNEIGLTLLNSAVLSEHIYRGFVDQHSMMLCSEASSMQQRSLGQHCSESYTLSQPWRWQRCKIQHPPPKLFIFQ